MWTCHKCGKPVYFAERKQSLGYDWHPECLRCEECGKRLNPGQHAEHKGVPYCHVPCYGALFGPTLFGHGSQVESHKSFGKIENRTAVPIQRSHLEAKLKLFNQHYEGKSHALKCRERNGKLILEGVLRIYWGVNNLIHLKQDDDQRTHVQIRKRNSYRIAINNGADGDDSSDLKLEKNSRARTEAEHDSENRTFDSNDEGDRENVLLEGGLKSVEGTSQMLGEATEMDFVDQMQCVTPASDHKCLTSNLNDKKSSSSDVDKNAVKPTVIISSLGDGRNTDDEKAAPVRIRKMASSRSKTKLKRRCSINGHFYNRETSVFTPPHGSATNVWITSLVNGPEVINMLLDKFRVENNPQDFALFVVRDNGETRRIQDHEYPLLVRVILGPHEDVAKVYIMDRNKTNEISNAVAQYLNFSDAELKAILQRFCEEEQREVKKVKRKYRNMRQVIQHRMAELQQLQGTKNRDS